MTNQNTSMTHASIPSGHRPRKHRPEKRRPDQRRPDQRQTSKRGTILVLAAGSAAVCGLLAGCGATGATAGTDQAAQDGQGESITLYSGQHEQTTNGLVTAFETVGLGGFGRRYPHQLSGGQQQRVALARALAIEPAVVLLDEPFASLDAHLRASVRADVQEIFRRAGTTAVLVTHDQDEALSVADRVAALRDGHIAQCAPPEELYCRPADPRLASFIGEANLLEGVVSGATVKTLLGALPLDPAAAIPGAAGQVTVLIRPEQIDIVPNEDGLTAR
jgi:ABC-type sugar transport system ATPase subunit